VNFEREWDSFLQREIQAAKGRRLERLQGELFGEKKMFREVLWPVFQSFEHFSLEYELKSITGVTIYVDALYHPLRLAFESEGFVPHAENITRERFSFERMRIRTLALYGYKHVPFSWDELDKHAESCRRFLYEMLGRYTGSDDHAVRNLSVYEREVIRCANRLLRPIKLQDVCECLGLKKEAARNVLRSLMEKKLVRPLGQGSKRIKLYVLEERAGNYIL